MKELKNEEWWTVLYRRDSVLSESGHNINVTQCVGRLVDLLKFTVSRIISLPLMKFAIKISPYLILCWVASLSSCKTNETVQPEPTVFDNPVTLTVASGDVEGYDVTVGDMDGDGKADLVGSVQNNVVVFRNMSTPGKFSRAFEGPFKFANPGNLSWINLIDIDGDGKLDVAQTNAAGARKVSVFRNNSNGVFNAQSLDAPIHFQIDTEPFSVQVADINHDAKADLVCFTPEKFSILSNNSTGGAFTSSAFLDNVSFEKGFTAELAAGDLNGDGKLDIAGPLAATPGSAVIEPGFGLFKYSTTGQSITPATFLDSTVLRVSSVLTTTINDIDGDGKNELMVNTSDGIVFYKNGPTTDAQVPPSISVSIAKEMAVTDKVYFSVYFEDFNGDHKPELFVVRLQRTGPAMLDVYVNTSTSSTISFGSPLTFDMKFSPSKLLFADMDGDGKKDLVGTFATDMMVMRNISF